MILYDSLCIKKTEVIWDHLESFDNKISYTISMQRSLSFFCGVSETVWSENERFRLRDQSYIT